MFNRYVVMILVCIFLQACASQRMPQELEKGKQDFGAGDYKQAFRELLPLASEGSPDAQYAVGYMYYYGYGVAQDSETGIFWMRKAANQRLPKAISALEMIEHKDRDAALSHK